MAKNATLRQRARKPSPSLTAAAALSLLMPALAPAYAQDQSPQPPPLASTATPAATPGDPPSRAGRLALLRGTVSTHAIDATQWSPAGINMPLTNGDALWTQPQSQARLEISASTIALNESTELDVSQLNAQIVAIAAPQGELFLHLQALAQGEVWTVLTPRGTVRLSAAGNYDIAAGANGDPTLVTVLDGAADISGAGIDLHVQPNQTATLTGAGPFDGSIGGTHHDAFIDAQLAPARAVHALPTGVPAYVATMTGAADLATVGQWQPSPQYGNVWYPPVQHDWVPYRDGHWSYVAPWGWSWVDNAPWGFAPSHYGRWVDDGGRWGWIPGERDAPRDGVAVYAPAMVAFLGIGLAAGALLARGDQRGGDPFGGRSIGWVPLGPGEPYHPPYHVSETYIRNVNVSNVRNTTTIINNYNAAPQPGAATRFANARGATEAPLAALAQSQPITAIGRPVSAASFAQARPIVATAPASASPLRSTQADRAAPAVAALPAPVAATAPAARVPGPAIDRALGHGATPHLVPASMQATPPAATATTNVQPAAKAGAAADHVAPAPAAPAAPGPAIVPHPAQALTPEAQRQLDHAAPRIQAAPAAQPPATTPAAQPPATTPAAHAPPAPATPGPAITQHPALPETGAAAHAPGNAVAQPAHPAPAVPPEPQRQLELVAPSPQLAPVAHPRAAAPVDTPHAALPAVQRPTPPAPPPRPETPVAPRPELAHPVMPQNTIPQNRMPQARMPETVLHQPEMPKQALPRPEMPKPEMPKPTMPRAELPRAQMPQQTRPAEHGQRPPLPQQ